MIAKAEELRGKVVSVDEERRRNGGKEEWREDGRGGDGETWAS